MGAINPRVLLFLCVCVCESVLSFMVPFGSTCGRKWFTEDEILTALRPQPFTAKNSLKRKRLITPDYYLLSPPLRAQLRPRRGGVGNKVTPPAMLKDWNENDHSISLHTTDFHKGYAQREVWTFIYLKIYFSLFVYQCSVQVGKKTNRKHRLNCWSRILQMLSSIKKPYKNELFKHNLWWNNFH